MTFIHTHRVRFHEVDLQGYLFNSRFLELADVAFTEYVRHLGFPYLDLMDAGSDPSVVKATVEFHRPARFEDVLEAHVQSLRVGTSSFDIRTTILRQGTPVATTDLVYVNVEAAAERSRPLPQGFAEALRADVAAVASPQEIR